MKSPPAEAAGPADLVEQRVQALLAEMSLDEKVGQMCLTNVGESCDLDDLGARVRAGQVGAVLNVVDVELVNELQRIGVEESRLGVPLLVGRDVIHGFRTIMPIPLGQAATWSPEIVERAARVSAREAASVGVNWAFAPMIDIARDPRWGRIAESFGEDPHLASVLGVAMLRGLQGSDLSRPDAIAACAKHFAGYGAVEAGRDYATVNLPENELRNVHLRPFEAAVEAGVATLMTSFSDMDGIPATANPHLLRRILRTEWQFRGFVVSDWDSVRQLAVHGLTSCDRDSAHEAAAAGVDMEMHGDAYARHLAQLVQHGDLGIDLIDAAVALILRLKFRLGLFDRPYTDSGRYAPLGDQEALSVSREAALHSVVMLRNERDCLPLTRRALRSLAVIGPLAEAPHDQLGTWVFDGDAGMSVTPLRALRDMLGSDVDVRFQKALATSRCRDTADFDDAVRVASQCDVTVLFLGEEAILSGEAHCRADIGLPGAQVELVSRIRRLGKPLVAIVLAGRPLTLTDIVDQVDALLFAWHPGSMSGPAIADLLFGVESPSGKLPVTFPKMVGQVPIYYNHKNTGKPPSPDTVVHIDDIDANARQLSLGMTSFHLDAGYTPLFPFGHGLSYGCFEYANIRVDRTTVRPGESLTVSAEVRNAGRRAAEEVVQLYVRDLVGQLTRPVRELKGFRRVHLEPGASATIEFTLETQALAYYGRDGTPVLEPGEFHVWIGGSSDAALRSAFRIEADES
jgi:beta-glucosidase